MSTGWAASRFGIAIPQVFPDHDVDMAAIRTVVTRSDAAGLHSAWTQSQLVGHASVLEPLTLLSYVASITKQIRLGTAVLNVPEHTPIQLAKQVASLDVVSDGRAIIGLGIGSPRHTFHVGGWEMDRPVRRLLETREILLRLWTEDAASFAGQLWQFDGLSMSPKPAQRPHPPLWLCGRHPNAMRRSVTYGDGWMGPGAASVAEFTSDVAELRRALDDADRDEQTFTIAKRVYVAVEDDRERAAAHLRQRFATYSSNPDRATVASVYGSIDDVRAGIDQLFDAGAALVVLNPVYDPAAQLEALLDLVAHQPSSDPSVASPPAEPDDDHAR